MINFIFIKEFFLMNQSCYLIKWNEFFQLKISDILLNNHFQIMSKDSSLKPFDIIDNYRVIKNIGHGGFGDIFLVRDINSNTPFALKLEKKPNQKVLIETEYSILKKIQGSLSFPRVITTGTIDYKKYIVLELLGPSINKVRLSTNVHKLSLSTALRSGIEMLCILRELHSRGFVHRDINSNNFLIRPSSPVPLCLIDFGLSKRYLDKTGEIIPQLEFSNFYGTPRYASLHAHRKFDLGPCDDVISWFFTMIELICGDLPWSISATKDEIMRMKETISDEDLCSGVPHQFIDIYRELKKLSYSDIPDYDFLINRLSEAMKENNIPSAGPYDWDKLPDHIFQSISPLPNKNKTNQIEEIPYDTVHTVNTASSETQETLLPTPFVTISEEEEHLNEKKCHCCLCWQQCIKSIFGLSG